MTNQSLSSPNTPNQVIARIGLISDTHRPSRCLNLPPTLFDALAGVDFLLHAGDVGELWVLDELSQIAPLIAVHGNDETADAQRELPLQQVVTFKGQRILLWHNHYPDRIDELTSRLDSQLRPRLSRIRQRARRAGANIAVFGHWHIPLVYEDQGVLLINPGAIAPPNFTHRQTLQSVAILTLFVDAPPAVAHINLAEPYQPFTPTIDWDAGFMAAFNPVVESILAADLAPLFPQLDAYILDQTPQAFPPYIEAQRRQSILCWSGQKDKITCEALLGELQQADLPQNIKQYAAELLD